MSYTVKDLLASPGYKEASPGDQKKMMAALQETLASRPARPMSWIRHFRKFECPGCGKIVERGCTTRYCEDCQKEHNAMRQQERRRANSKRFKRVNTKMFSVLRTVQVKCRQCGNKFIPKRSTARFCSAKCRVYWHRAKKAN